jgi:hypothetical protein
MPSDDALLQGALEAMREPAEEFHSALAGAIEDLRSFLSRHRATGDDPESATAAELGTFGEGRVDAARFAAVVAPPEAIGSNDLHHVERALRILETAEARGDDQLRVEVHSGGDLRATVDRVLGEIGRVFGAIRCIAPLIDGRGEVADAGGLSGDYPYERWTRAERAAAPPLFVELDGTDLDASGLSTFLDGTQKIVLVVKGAAAPAPLAPLITPGVFVMQTGEPTDLTNAARFKGPAIIALGGEGLSRFVHDPSGGVCYADRLLVEFPPDADGKRQLNFRQAQDLEHLRGLAASRRPADSTNGGSAPVASAQSDPVGRLAGWLLQQANLADGEEQA